MPEAEEPNLTPAGNAPVLTLTPQALQEMIANATAAAVSQITGAVPPKPAEPKPLHPSKQKLLDVAGAAKQIDPDKTAEAVALLALRLERLEDNQFANSQRASAVFVPDRCPKQCPLPDMRS